MNFESLKRKKQYKEVSENSHASSKKMKSESKKNKLRRRRNVVEKHLKVEKVRRDRRRTVSGLD